MNGILLFNPFCKRESGLPGLHAFGTKEGAAAKITWVQLPGVEQECEVQTTETPQQRHSAQSLTAFPKTILAGDTKVLKICPIPFYVVYKYLRFDAEQWLYV